jgi:hypothetical protein
MKAKRLAVLLCISALIFFTTGCEWASWLRLLSLKKQFAQLERYVRVEDKHGLTLDFVKPVVYADDLRLLVEEETLHTTNGNVQTWVWTYEKQTAESAASSGEFDLSFTAVFENLKFAELRFPERFLAVLPKPLILGMLRSIGKADIDLKHGTFNFKWAGSDKEKIELPAKPQVIALLGPPFSISESNGTHTFLYKYYEKTSTPQSLAERLAWAKFTFVGESDQIIRSEGAIGNITWTMSAVSGQKEMNIAVALAALSVEPVALKLPAEITDQYIGQYKEPGGMILNIGDDGGAFVASWSGQGHGGWCIVLPESTNAFFALPAGDPHCAFLRDNHGAVTGLVAHLNGSNQPFAKITGPLPQATRVAQISLEAVAACAGVYKASWGGRVVLHNDGGHLFWQTPGIETKLPLYPKSETNFFFRPVDSPLTFVKNDKGVVTKFILHYGGHTADAAKIKSK